jgi:hypothetical protein
MKENNMKKKQKLELCQKLDWEGGFEAFITYSDFPEITDEKFRGLVDAYKLAYQNLSKYIGWDTFEPE